MTAVVGKPNFDFWEVAIVTELDLTVFVLSSAWTGKEALTYWRGVERSRQASLFQKKCQKQAVMKMSLSLQCLGEREKLSASALRAALKPRAGAASDFTDRLCSLNFPSQGARSTIVITSSSTQSTKKGWRSAGNHSSCNSRRAAATCGSGAILDASIGTASLEGCRINNESSVFSLQLKRASNRMTSHLASCHY